MGWTSNCSASCASVRSPLIAASATFALKAGVWFRRGRLFMVSPDSQAIACPLSGTNSTYRPVQISGAGSGPWANVPDQVTDDWPDGCGRLQLGFAFSDPGRHLVIIVGDVILGNVVGGRVPDAVVAEDVPQSLVEMLRRIRAPDIVRMKRKTHHAPVFRSFVIERVELVFDHLQEIIRVTIPCQHTRIICLAGIRNVNKLLAAADVDRPGLII